MTCRFPFDWMMDVEGAGLAASREDSGGGGGAAAAPPHAPLRELKLSVMPDERQFERGHHGQRAVAQLGLELFGGEVEVSLLALLRADGDRHRLPLSVLLVPRDDVVGARRH